MTTTQRTRSQRPWLVFSCMAGLAFLGGGAGSDAGIQGTGHFSVLAFGRITAFGSIFVDDVEYSLDNASISIDGRPATGSQLRVGQIVTVQGFETPSGESGAATTVSFTPDIVGPVGQLDIAGSTVTILGQTVQLDALTLLGPGIQAGALPGLQLGVNLQVSGFEDASGILHATRIDLVSGSAPLQVKGTVQALDPAARTFKLNDLTVDYSGAQLSGNLANGSTAIVQTNESPAGSVLYAAQVQASSGLGGTADKTGRLEGLITSMASAQAFVVAGQAVQTDASTHFVLHGQTLAPNLSVQIHGRFTATGVLQADLVKATPWHP